MLKFLRQLVEAARVASERKRTAQGLLRLNDYLLTDIGVRRDDLELVAAGLWIEAETRARRQAPAPILAPQQALVRVGPSMMQGCG